MTTVYNLFTNPSFISNTTGWSGYTVGTKSGLVSTLVIGSNEVVLTTGTTSGMSVGQKLFYVSGAGTFVFLTLIIVFNIVIHPESDTSCFIFFI